MTIPAQAEARTLKRDGRTHYKKVQPWHGWGNSFYLDGVRYPGGNPRGPTKALNNWEGGFHPEAYWELLRRQSG
jgi:hypothetical protein